MAAFPAWCYWPRMSVLCHEFLAGDVGPPLTLLGQRISRITRMFTLSQAPLDSPRDAGFWTPLAYCQGSAVPFHSGFHNYTAWHTFCFCTLPFYSRWKPGVNCARETRATQGHRKANYSWREHLMLMQIRESGCNNAGRSSEGVFLPSMTLKPAEDRYLRYF